MWLVSWFFWTALLRRPIAEANVSVSNGLWKFMKNSLCFKVCLCFPSYGFEIFTVVNFKFIDVNLPVFHLHFVLSAKVLFQF